MLSKVLIIEDEPAILLTLKDELCAEFEVITANNGRQGLELGLKAQPGLILLDILLPDLDGFQVCSQLRSNGVDSAVIMLTAKDQTEDKIAGLEAGADDYLTKPFSLSELKARIKAVTRRRQMVPIDKFESRDLEIDFKNFLARHKNKIIKLGPLEFKLLRFLIFHKTEAVSREQILEQVWGYHTIPSTRTIDEHILSLRKKIGSNHIHTVRGIGYRFTE